MRKRICLISMALLFSVSITIGCSKSESTAEPKGKDAPVAINAIPDEPITLRMFVHSANISNDEFKDLIADPVNKKFPNVTMQVVRTDPKITREALISSGDFPEFIYVNTTAIQEDTKLKLPIDLNPIIKKYNYDIDRFQKRYLDDIRANADNGQLFGLPFSTNFDVLYYNRDIFDKFGIAYPKDGMTWDDAIQLAKKLNRKEDDVQYIGLHPTLMRYFSTQLSAPFINPKTLKPELGIDAWKKSLEMYKAIADVNNGNMDTNATLGLFNKDRRLAMLAHYGARVGEFEQLERSGNPLNWDMVTYPVYKEKPGISQGADTHYIMITSTNKYPEAAFQVLTYLLSDDMQTAMSRRGRLSTLKNPKIKENFGADVATLQGKHLDAIFKSTPAPLPVPTIYDDFVKNNMQAIVNDMLAGKMDINTALAKVEDKVNQLIEADKKDNQ